MSFVDRVRNAADPRALSALVQRSVKHADRTRAVYPALGELARRWGGGLDLTASELRVFSQNGEDGVIAAIFDAIGTGGGGFVEFGIQDGTEGNSVFLAQVLGWSGVFLEADDAGYAALERRFAANPRVRTVHAAVEPDTVERLFAQAGVPEEPDLVSIDVDGNDLWIWRALTAYRPRLVIVEYNGAIDPRERRAMPYTPGYRWDGTSDYGASLGALEDLATEKGYRLVHTELTGVNAFFVRGDLAGGLPSGDAVPRRSANHVLMGLGHPAPRSGPSRVY
jgi:hypothetical protein